MKFYMAYRRSRHFGKDKVTMDFTFFAIAFYIKKICAKIAKQAKNRRNTSRFGLFLLLCRFYPLRINYFEKPAKNPHLENILTSKHKIRGCAVKH